jgi:EmrB/QacA subfamily drug resistance transporter
VLTSAAQFMGALDALIVSTALGTIKQQLHASIEQLEWTVNAYALTFAVSLMTAAVLGDRFGRRRMFTTGVAVFTAASAAGAAAPGIGWLIAARAVQGTGAALVAANGMALLASAYPPHRRGWALGIFSGAVGLAVLSGPIAGGAITQGLAWQWIFLINVPIGVALIPLALMRVPESRGPAAAVDLPGVALVTAAALGLVWGLVRGNSAGWASPEVAGTLTAGTALVIAFIAWELRAPTPMLPMRLFGSPAFVTGNAISFLLFASNFSTVFFMAQFQQVALGQDPLGAGIRLLPWTAPLFFVGPRAGKLADRIGERPLIVGGLLLQTAGMATIAVIAAPRLAYVSMIAPMVIAATGIAMAMPAVQKAVVGSVSPPDIGKASGTYNTMRWFGAVFGVAILVAVFAATGSYASPHSFTQGFSHALAASAAIALIGAMTGLTLPGKQATTTTTRQSAIVATGAGKALTSASRKRLRPEPESDNMTSETVHRRPSLSAGLKHYC